MSTLHPNPRPFAAAKRSGQALPKGARKRLRKIVCIVGPTASGKTALGIMLAKQFNGEVVSADSRMVYKGMEIGTAVPLGRGIFLNVEGVPHYLIGIVEPDQAFTVVDWREEAIAVIEDMLERGKLPIVVGGTGLYFSVLLDNFEIPEGIADKELREKVELAMRESSSAEVTEGKPWPVEQLLAIDPDAAKKVDLKNPRRVARALEVSLATGRPFTQQRIKRAPLYEALQIGLNVENEKLEQRLQKRTQQQLQDGLINEVKRLKEKYGCDVPPMKGFIYKEMCQYLAGALTIENTIRLINLRNRQYAKRQRQWFRRDKRIQWIDDPKEAEKLVRRFLES